MSLSGSMFTELKVLFLRCIPMLKLLHIQLEWWG